MQPIHGLLGIAVLFGVVACSSADPTRPTTATKPSSSAAPTGAPPSGNPTQAERPKPRAKELVAALRDADPGQWPELIPAVAQLGLGASAALQRAVADHPQSPGRQPILELLGRTGDRDAAPTLRSALSSRAANPEEAALALGRLGAGAEPDPETVRVLSETLSDARGATSVRTAAACALWELHQGANFGNSKSRDRAGRFLVGILLAGTPAGRRLNEAHGWQLPDRPRWALERHFVITTIARTQGGNRFGLDTDQPWPTLLKRTRTMAEALGIPVELDAAPGVQAK